MQNFQQKWHFSDYPKSAHGWAQKLRHCDILSTQHGILHSVAFDLKFSCPSHHSSSGAAMYSQYNLSYLGCNKLREMVDNGHVL